MDFFTLLIQSITFGLAVAFILLGIVGMVVPLLPGSLLIWLTIAGYAFVTGFEAITPVWLGVLSVLALVVGSADWWLPMLGARASGASRRSSLYGLAGGIAGFFAFALVGSIVGYALGVVLGEYQKHQDLKRALRISAGGLAGMGLATGVQLGGGLLMLGIFVWRVLAIS
jgi:uncharacterized protein YqgC (DUF456 family)